MAGLLTWALAGVIAAAPLASCETATAWGAAPPPVRSGGTCAPADNEIDYHRVRADPQALSLAVKRAREGHIEVRRKAGVESLDTRGDHIAMFSWGSMLPGRYSVQARRNNAGVWTIERVSEGRDGGGRLPPEAPSVQRATLTGEKAAELDRLLGDRCLYAEPTYYGRTVPTLPTGEGTCMDGADSLIEIEAGGRSHTSFHACHAYGRPAKVAMLLWQALAPAA